MERISKFFSLRVNLFLEAHCVQESKQEVSRVVGLVKVFENLPSVPIQITDYTFTRIVAHFCISDKMVPIKAC